MQEEFSYKRTTWFGIFIILVIFGGFGIWAAFAKIDLSVQAPGRLIVQSYKKSVSHPQGGFVKEIYVKEGDSVKIDQPLLRLDTTQIEAKLAGSKKALSQLLAQRERIRAQLEGRKPDFSKVKDREVVAKEKDVYRNEIENLKKELQHIDLQITETRKSMEELEMRIDTDKKLLFSYENELQKWQKLFDEGYVDELKILEIQRKIEQIKGEMSSFQKELEQKKAQIKRLQTQKDLIKTRYKKELEQKLQQINQKIPELKSQIEVYNDIIRKSFIKAPSSGKVESMQIHAVGEVVVPNKPMMYIVPQEDKLVVEAKVSPMDIDKVHVGQKAEIQFASYVDPSAKPVYGEVTYISADVIKDPHDPGIEYYKVLVQITKEGKKAIKENGFLIKPGMPVTVFIKAGQRSFLSYILLPVEQLLKGAFHAN